MAKYRRTVVGSVVKGKDGKPDYIKISNDVVLKKGEFLNLESKASQVKSIEEAVQAGRMSAETAESILEKINATPDFVRFNIVKIDKE